MIDQAEIEQERINAEAVVEQEAVTEVREQVLSTEREKELQLKRMAAIQSVKKILDKTSVAFLTTISGKHLVSCPMYVQNKEFDGTLWFFAKRDSSKVEDIRKDSRVNVLFAEKSPVSLSGRAEIVENDLKKKMYWTRSIERLFETGYENPEIVLIKIEALSAQLWKSPGPFAARFNSVVPLSEENAKVVEF
ncbi:MAG: pyridoxamine 5'-phosphate oxidase family protein [Clostridiales bacterium]|nr:pyridoxamine 5'-phosphate oxidase family protein [Clostridiales bacterium]